MVKRLLLLSNSKDEEGGYLVYPESEIRGFLGKAIKKVLFIPYAQVLMSHDKFAEQVGKRFSDMGYELESLHQSVDPLGAIKNAEAIVIGGGNTFVLLQHLYEIDILDLIRKRVEQGVPYIGWSAGANLASPNIMTTNDMPVIEFSSLNSFNFVPFQINPHYFDHESDSKPQGETREQRIKEFCLLNPDVFVVGLRELTLLRVEGDEIKFIGSRNVRIFKGEEDKEHEPGSSLSFLLK